jgi:thiamine-phosphate pyrophosphorylase
MLQPQHPTHNTQHHRFPAKNLAESLRLLLILDIPLLGDRDPVAAALSAVSGGVTSVQLRWKGGADREVVALARELRHALAVPVVVNDRLDIALATGCAGVHLGAADLPIALARKIAPPGFLVGASVGDEQEARLAEGADYVGIGPWRATNTKTDAGAALGPDGVRRLLVLVKVPAVVIGGVRPIDVAELAVLGAAGVAVAGGILGPTDTEAAARGYSNA